MDDIIKSIYGHLSGFALSGKAEKFIKKTGEIIFPFLLCLTMMSAGLYIYTENVIDIYNVIAAAVCAGVFALCSCLRKIKFGGLIYTGLIFAGSFIPGIMLPGWESKFGFVRWFFSGAKAEDTRVSFALVFILVFGFFFCSVVYYFTQIVYRSAAVVLISMIPMALAVKAVVSMPVYYPIILASLDLIIFIFYSRKKIVGKSLSGNSMSSLIVYTDFAVAAIILALIVPKPSETPFYDKFEGFMNLFQFGGSGETVMSGEYNRYSGNADDLLMQESRLLYVIASPQPTYMKTQVFDNYDASNNRWEADVSGLSGNRYWQDTAQSMNFEYLDNALQKAAELDEDFYEQYPFAEKLNGISDPETYSIIYSRQYPAAYVIAPLRTFGVNLSTTGASYSARSGSGEIFTDLVQLPGTADYTVRYYSEDTVYHELISNGYCDISAEEYENMLRRAEELLYPENDLSEEYNVVHTFLNECISAEAYRERTVTDIPESIQALSDELTSGLEYDYQKASAIEQYFYNNGFLYSLAYEAPENSDTAEYFLFESKTGTCSDFASAYTLLARAAGLTVRYVEGFVPQAGDEPGDRTFYIYFENAHAYPEVFIPGAGWVRYEPTIADFSGGSGRDNADIGTDMLTAVFTAVIAVICIGIFILLIILKPKIEETAFRAAVRFKRNDTAVKLLYRRHAQTAGIKYGAPYRAMTADEISVLTEENTGISLEPLADSFTEVCYGRKPVTGEQRRSAYDCYKAQYKEMTHKTKKGKDR